MPRPVSWLPRLAQIRSLAENSVLSHWNRRDIERLFQVQPRTAGKLVEMLQTDGVGTSRLVGRAALLDFLEQVRQADDVPALLERIRLEKRRPARTKLRSLTVDDVYTPVELGEIALPASLELSRGAVTVRFRDVVELLEAFGNLLRVVESAGFHRAYVPPSEKAVAAVQQREWDQELARREEEWRAVHPPESAAEADWRRTHPADCAAWFRRFRSRKPAVAEQVPAARREA